MAEKEAHSHNENNNSENREHPDAFSEGLLRYFVKHCPNAAAIFDRNMVYLACSDRHLQDYELSEEQVIGKNHYEVFPDIPQKFRDVHQRVLQGAIEKNKNDMFTQLDGSICYVSWECRPWYDAKGKIGGIILYFGCDHRSDTPPPGSKGSSRPG